MTDGSNGSPGSAQDSPQKPWGKKTRELPNYVMDSLYTVKRLLDKKARTRLGLTMKVPVFIQDPLVALENPVLGIEEIEVRLEEGFGDGPTSSRIAVVDYNASTQLVTEPVEWNGDVGWFSTPSDGTNGGSSWLPDAPPKKSKDEEKYRAFIEQTVSNPHFHQVNVWAIVQRVLEFYEHTRALGRPIPWGFDGNRLLVVPHAAYGTNAFYDGQSKSLQFYYFGDGASPGYTCLSFDIVAHETGHAILDGIRPMYNQLSSIQSRAFHEFIGDLTAILLALDNKDIRDFLSKTTHGNLEGADILANIAEQFGLEVEDRPYLRTAFNKYTMNDVAKSLSPHFVSEVLSGAMFEILSGIATKHMEKNRPDDEGDAEENSDARKGSKRKVTPAKALYWAYDRFRRVALQPLDLCPPCDIQFIDYARAVIRNDILTNPVDEQGYRELMYSVFHKREICECGYQEGQDLPADCLFQEALETPDLRFVFHSIGRLSRSRTAAYYFLADNRRMLHIPPHQDVVIADLYDTNKQGAKAVRLPREVVLEYTWQEEVILADDADHDLSFGEWNGKSFFMDCGGTLVFDERGNLHCWFRKPGTEHISEETAQNIRDRAAAWQQDPAKAKEQKIDKVTKLELRELADLEEGDRRKAAVLKYLSALIETNQIGPLQLDNRFDDGARPIAFVEDGETLRFEITPHLRKADYVSEEQQWMIDY